MTSNVINERQRKKKKKMDICERVDERQSETEEKELLCYIMLNNNELDLNIGNNILKLLLSRLMSIDQSF